jgi:carbonic anhydrase
VPEKHKNKMENDQIFKNNKKWVSERLALDPEYFKNLSKGQSPEHLYIGCSDSRVSAETLMGLQPGEVFVHRNVANLVPNTDVNVLSVINYAVVHLKVKNIVVCGHYNCGGILAATETSDLGILNPWLKNIRDVYRLHKHEIENIDGEDEKLKRFVHLNVQEQCINVLKIIEVQEAVKKGKLKVHGWVFDIFTGRLIDLNIDTGSIIKDLMEVSNI